MRHTADNKPVRFMIGWGNMSCLKIASRPIAAWFKAHICVFVKKKKGFFFSLNGEYYLEDFLIQYTEDKSIKQYK